MPRRPAAFTEAECRRAIRVAQRHNVPRVEMVDAKGRTLVFVLKGEPVSAVGNDNKTADGSAEVRLW